jgi:hypothetical protein
VVVTATATIAWSGLPYHHQAPRGTENARSPPDRAFAFQETLPRINQAVAAAAFFLSCTTLRIATWNVNSVRLRIAAFERLVAAFNPDVPCLQKTNVVDENFPLAALAGLGYRHTMVHGMKSYNGVAILSRLPLATRRRGLGAIATTAGTSSRDFPATSRCTTSMCRRAATFAIRR